MAKKRSEGRVDPHRVIGARRVNGVAAAGADRLLTASMGGEQVQLWDTKRCVELGSFGTGTGSVCWYATASRDGQVAAGFGDCSLRIWNPEKKSVRTLDKLQDLQGIVASLAWSADGKLLFTGNCGDNTVRLWDVAAGKIVARGRTKKSATWFVAMTGDARMAVSGGGGKVVHLWEPKTGKELAQLEGHTGKILGFAMFPDGRRAASASQDKSVRVWDLELQRQLLVLGGHTKQVTSVVVSPDGKQLASASSDGKIRLWNAETGAPERVISVGGTAAASVDYSPDGLELFAGCEDGQLRAFALGDTSAARNSAAMFEAVWAAPKDDGPRGVLADFLSEQGDPRGEFIALQLSRARGTSSVASRKRERELLKLHEHEWVGPIAPLVETSFLEFERGFVSTCALKAVVEKGAPPPRHPAWATVSGFVEKPGAPASLVKHLEALGARRVKK